MAYPFADIEPKWQSRWEESRLFEATLDKSKPKYYVLDMFPYPSGQGLHVGHPEGYTASDIIARYKRAKGFNVLHPMGWDAYGLPAEQYAIKTGIHPEQTTKEAIANFTRQLKSLGFSYDWSREIATCDPKYYKWTQWIFLKLFDKGLAYQKEVPVNWCPELKTVLANDEVVDGKSERGGHPVVQRPMVQWMLKITDYAERLLQDLDTVDWPEHTKKRQRDWIGKSTGAEVRFPIKGFDEALDIFTTRPDTMYGVTFMVVAPEHPLALTIIAEDKQAEAKTYIEEASRKSELDRQSDNNKTGVFTGAYCVNPLNGAEVPIYIADYVLMDYGTGAIMAVPAHDTRDYDFAQAHGIEVIQVIDGPELPHTGEGKHINSEIIDGMDKDEAIATIVKHIEEHGLGKAQVQYRLRDWLFSRQRYWGEPFPAVHFPKRGLTAMPESELPLLLPPISKYEPGDDGDPPLGNADESWLKVDDGEEVGTRDLNTMPGAAGSSWYFLRYCDPHNDEAPVGFEAQEYWMPVDLYVGGPEHAVGHLLYSRFWQKVLFDAGVVSHEEPFQKMIHQGMIQGEDGGKMSKSRGNVINPDDMLVEYGADAFRMYEMFMGPLDKDKPWNTQGLVGVYKFLNKFWNAIHDADGNFIVDDSEPTDDQLKILHKTIKKVTDDIEGIDFNTAISQMMIFVNEFGKTATRPKAVVKAFVQILSPFAPHICEELWEKLGEEGFVSVAPWPTYDESRLVEDTVEVVVQIKGKRRSVVSVAADADQATVEAAAKEDSKVAEQLEGKDIKKVIFVPGRIINFIAV